MMGFILLAGGAEFSGRMAAADQLAVQLAGGADAAIAIVPTAAAPDNNHRRAGQNGVNWFKDLGAKNVSALPLIDSTSADDPSISEALALSGLIYLLGGFPRHLAHSLRESRSWQAILSAYQTGAVIAGSSAGAMVLCEYYYDPDSCRVMEGLNLIRGPCVLPHHDTFGQNWAPRLSQLLPASVLLGIDEETGLICDMPAETGCLHGKGGITVYREGLIDRIKPEQEFNLERLNISGLER